jgi:NAD(P)-dependent dehydrogenase (short-subunit alcohol dehydrogenase family)
MKEAETFRLPLAGRKALVTGAGMGIGQGIALELARQGAAVAVHYARSEQGAFETVAEIQRRGGQAIALSGDLSRVRECERVVGEAVQTLGGLDILVNNAGVTRALDFVDTSEAIYDEVFDLNMKGYFFCAQYALPSCCSGLGVASLILPQCMHSAVSRAMQPTLLQRGLSMLSRANWRSNWPHEVSG